MPREGAITFRDIAGKLTVLRVQAVPGAPDLSKVGSRLSEAGEPRSRSLRPST